MRPRRFLQCFGAFELLLDDFTQSGRERKVSAFPVFGFARIKPQPAAPLRVSMMFLAAKNFVVNAPARNVGCLDGGLQVLGQIFENGMKTVPTQRILFSCCLTPAFRCTA